MFGINNGQHLFNNNNYTNTNINTNYAYNNDTSNIFKQNSNNSLLIRNNQNTNEKNNINYHTSENSEKYSENSEKYSENSEKYSENSENSKNIKNNIAELNNTIDSFKKEIDELKNLIKLQLKINNNKSNGIYIKCNLHEHLLKETVVTDVLDVYTNGFVCDNCNYKQHNINEKFYHCQECSSISGLGNYDLCIECVKKYF